MKLSTQPKHQCRKYAEKLKLVELAQHQHSVLGKSYRVIASELGVHRNKLALWIKNKNHLVTMQRARTLSCRRVSNGRVRSLDYLWDQLVSWMVAKRKLGYALNYRTMVAVAVHLDPSLLNVSYNVLYQRVCRLIRSNGYGLRMKTNHAQKKPSDMEEDATSNWMIFIRPIIGNPTTRRILTINMDETPVYGSHHSNQTLERTGAATVHVLMSPGFSYRVTCALGVWADGTKIKPMVIFKGSTNGIIARNELPTYKSYNRVKYAVQEKAWMDVKMMDIWIDDCLVPHIQQQANGGAVVLLLDQVPSHKAQATLEKLANLGIELQLIPGGTTSLVQPVDVGINKPFKDRLRRYWWQWVIANATLEDPSPKPRRSDIASWIDQAWSNISPEIICNSWRSSEYYYYDNK